MVTPTKICTFQALREGEQLPEPVRANIRVEHFPDNLCEVGGADRRAGKGGRHHIGSRLVVDQGEYR
jgi:hypothetical protein